MIVLDASAAVDWLLQTSAGQNIETRIYSRKETLHAPHLLDLEVTAVLRRLALQGVVSVHRAAEALSDLLDLRIARYLISCSCPASGNSVTIFRHMMLPTLLLPRHSVPHQLIGMLDSRPLRAIRPRSSSFNSTLRCNSPALLASFSGRHNRAPQTPAQPTRFPAPLVKCSLFGAKPKNADTHERRYTGPGCA